MPKIVYRDYLKVGSANTSWCSWKRNRFTVVLIFSPTPFFPFDVSKILLHQSHISYSSFFFYSYFNLHAESNIIMMFDGVDKSYLHLLFNWWPCRDELSLFRNFYCPSLYCAGNGKFQQWKHKVNVYFWEKDFFCECISVHFKKLRFPFIMKN